jgi:hypothetical protein
MWNNIGTSILIAMMLGTLAWAALAMRRSK